jgi:hypothetical protein
MTTPRDELQQMIEDCEKRESRMNDWQRGFVDSISRQLAEGRTLTPKQDEALTEVWNQVTEKG